MDVQRRNLSGALLSAACLLAAALPASHGAPPPATNDELGFLAGAVLVDEDLVGPESNGLGVIGGVRWSHLFTATIGISVDGAYAPHYHGEAPYTDWSELLLNGSMDWFFADTEHTRWFLSPGIGWSAFSPDSGEDANRVMLSLGIGQKIYPGDPSANIWWQVRADQSVTSSGIDGAGVLQMRLLFGVAWGLGGPPPDADADGVPNWGDDCPATPAGATVDAKGCPADSDADAVLDGLDRCPDTTRGWPVDASGCPVDTDGDGVPDGGDTCPDTPKGAKVDDKGCPLDADKDGVFDGIDTCPDTPKGAKVDDKGCPSDADKDGVFDGIDACPDTPAKAKVDDKGCPLPVKAPPPVSVEKPTLVLEGVTFANASAELAPESAATLDQVAASLKDWPELIVEIGGYTDASGSAAYNQKLSERRAQSVMDYLVSKGVSAAQLVATGYGEDAPIADNGTEAGRAKNRRVELKKLD